MYAADRVNKYLKVAEFSLPVTTSLLVSTETLKIKYFSLTTFVAERFISGYQFPVNWTFGIPQPAKHKETNN